MKILVSAFACSPYQGSEPGVGWTAVQQIALDHEVFVICDEHAREPMSRAMAENLVPSNVKFRFTGNPTTSHSNRMIARIQDWMTYRNYSRQVLAAASEWHREVGFDLCHQVTIASFRVPSPLWQLPIPFVWGPIGGAGTVPPAFRSMMSPSARGFEKIRDINTLITTRSKAFLDCVRNAAVVVPANEEMARFLAPYRNHRPLVQLPIVSLPPEKIALFQTRIATPPDDGPLLLFAGGSLLGSKGVSLALKALAHVKQQGVKCHYTLAGGGPERESLQRLVRQLGLDAEVTFHPGYQKDEYIRALQSHHAYLLPSFREGTPVTMLEACLAGCYPVVADISAPGEIVRLAGGIAAKAESQNGLVRELSAAIQWCDRNRGALRQEAMDASRQVADHFSAARYRQCLNGIYATAMN
jgi:glycosyltransferase involved in cell wall biosynthesis